MRNIGAILFSFLVNTAFAQVKNGEKVDDIRFNVILNAPVKQASLASLKGKLVILDFWATWSTPSAINIKALAALQNQYADKIQVVALTQESSKRTSQFIKSQPSSIWFSVDSAGVIAGIFPHYFVPHTVLIAPDGKLIAATMPKYITANVIDSILSNKTVHLPQTPNNVLTADGLLQYVHADDTVQNRFFIQPEIKGEPGSSNNYADNPAFNGRRITAINLSPISLYELAYGGFPFSRIVNMIIKKEKLSEYCLDIIVPKKADLLPTLQKELAKRFEMQARLEQHPKEVYVLKIANPEKFKSLPVNTGGNPTYFERKGEIDQQDMSMADLAEYLESYCINTAVIDETGSTQKFDIKFSYAPEKSHSLSDALATIGLSISKEKRKIDMLILYENAQ